MTVAGSTFFNELDLLELRLKTLENVVDQFVVCEAPVTFMGNPKPLHFADNRERFKRWPIKHVVVQDMPGGSDPWKREEHQIMAMWAATHEIGAEYVYLSDLDEIPRPEAFAKFRDVGVPVVALNMVTLLYYLDRLLPPVHVDRASIARKPKKYPGRARGNMPIFRDAGWHCAYMGHPTGLLMDKLNATSHAPEPGAENFRDALRHGIMPRLEETVEYAIDRRPLPVQMEPELWRSRGLLCPQPPP